MNVSAPAVSLKLVFIKLWLMRSALPDIPYDQMVEDTIDMKDKEAFIAAIVVGRMPERRRWKTT